MHYLVLRHKTKRRQPLLKKIIKRRVTILDKLAFITGIVGPFTVLPQIYDLFTKKVATGVSLESWVLLFIISLPWIFYGIVHKDKTITVSYILWEIMNIAVVVGVLLYR